MTPERIAAIEARGCHPALILAMPSEEVAVLCRLARLGLVAEELADAVRYLHATCDVDDHADGCGINKGFSTCECGTHAFAAYRKAKEVP